jgi:hypothetical protein
MIVWDKEKHRIAYRIIDGEKVYPEYREKKGEPKEEEKPKRKRRTKAEIEADKAEEKNGDNF